MSNSSVRTSKQDKVLKGTLDLLEDNNNKLNVIAQIDIFITSLMSNPINENDVKRIVNMCKEFLVNSHSIVMNSLPKINVDTKKIIEVLHCMESQLSDNSDDDINYFEIKDVSMTLFFSIQT